MLEFLYEQYEESRELNVLKNISRKSSIELLTQLNEKEAREYCKYIGVSPDGGDSIAECAKAFWKELELHPEYLAYIFQDYEMEELFELVHAPNSVCSKPPQQEMTAKALALGFFDLSEETVNSSRYVVLRQMPEAGKLISRYKKNEWKRILKTGWKICLRRQDARITN